MLTWILILKKEKLFYLKEVFVLSWWRIASPQASARLQGQILYDAATPFSSSFFSTDHEILPKPGSEIKKNHTKIQTFLMDTRYHIADLIRQIRNKEIYLHTYICIFCFISNKFGRPDLALCSDHRKHNYVDSRIKPSISF